MEQIVLRETMMHLRDNQGIRPRQNGFTKGRSCLTNMISFCELVILLVDEGKAVEMVYLDFSKAFDTVSHSILLEKLAAHGLDRYALGLAIQPVLYPAKRVGVMELSPAGNQSCVVFPRGQYRDPACLIFTDDLDEGNEVHCRFHR